LLDELLLLELNELLELLELERDELLELEEELLFELDELDERELLLELELDDCVCAMTVDNDSVRGLNCIGCARLMGSSDWASFTPKMAPNLRIGFWDFASFSNEPSPVPFDPEDSFCFAINLVCFISVEGYPTSCNEA
jgi:hypothetical protein